MHFSRVRETTATTGTGTYNLAGAADGFIDFITAAGTGGKVYYVASDGDTGYEWGIGTVTAGTPPTLSRDTILGSSNAGAAVNWAAGTKAIFCALPAEQMAVPDISDITTSGQLDNLAVGVRGAFRLTQATMLTGIAGGGRGKMHLVVNANSVALTIADSNINSTAANRIVTPTGDDILVPAGGMALFWYDVTASRWRCVAAPDPTIATFGSDITTSGSLDNVAIGTAGAIRFTQATHISGIAGGVHGRVLIVHNVSASELTLQDSDTSSSAANRLALPADIVLPADGIAILQYDGTAQRWHAIGTSSGLRSAIATATRDLTAASGDVDYTGFGFTPTTLRIMAFVSSGSLGGGGNSDGFSDSAGNQRVKTFSTDTAVVVNSAGGIVYYTNAAQSTSQLGALASYIADGFRLTWTKTGSPSGTLTLYIIAYR